MSLDFLQPFAGAHAIQQASFNLQWSAMALGSADRKVEICIEEMGEAMRCLGLQSVVPISMVQFQIGPGAPNQAMSPGVVTGYEGRLSASVAGPMFVVTASAHDGLVIQVRQYTRWAPVFAQVLTIAQALLPVAAKAAPLVRLGLQVVDSFNWNGPVEELVVSDVFRRDSPWMSPHAFECRSFWHCHHGYFESVELEGCTQQLNNVNVSVSSASEVPLLQAALIHQVELVQSEWWVRNPESAGRIGPIFEKLHADNKAAIGKLFTDDVAKRVALWGRSQNRDGDHV